jgi:predicted nucleotidyltransferase
MDDVKKKIIPIIQKYGVKKAAFFGSYARSEAGEDSDVDILIENPGISLFKILGLKVSLEEGLGKKVDLVIYSALHLYLRDRILADQVVIFEE